MPDHRFLRYEHRTRDLDAARTFYAAIFGDDFWGDDVVLSNIPERAAALGAPPHWVGHVGVDDVATVRAKVLASGGQALGPLVLRDPYGALIAPCPRGVARRTPVDWHLHTSNDVAGASTLYASTFGLDFGRDKVGFMDVTMRPDIHAQWLFFFPVADFEQASNEVRSRGGRVMEPTTNEQGARVAACEDPQRGAFGLIERR